MKRHKAKWNCPRCDGRKTIEMPEHTGKLHIIECQFCQSKLRERYELRIDEKLEEEEEMIRISISKEKIDKMMKRK